MNTSNSLSDCGAPLTDEAVARAETTLGVSLPSRYRGFLLRENGGIPDRRFMRIVGHRDGTDLFQFFLSVDHREPFRDLVETNRSLPCYRGRGLLCIGATASASVLCLDLRYHHPDTLFYIDVADPLDEHGLKPLYFVAADVSEFLNGLS